MDCDENDQSYKLKIPRVPSDPKETDSTKTLTVHLENKVKELHTNVRHITQLGMTWFAFFVTVNYVTMGWLAKGPSSGSESINPLIIYTVAVVFILQNGLGIVGLCKVRKTAKAGATQVKTYENWLLNACESYSDKPHNDCDITVLERSSIPTKLYAGITLFLMIVLASLIVAWVFIIYFYIYAHITLSLMILLALLIVAGVFIVFLLSKFC
jgi:hypothetical protein